LPLTGKFANQQINVDGLIGTCALERKTIHMKKVPDKYIRVTSGLGEANPKGILLNPCFMKMRFMAFLNLPLWNHSSHSKLTLLQNR
jgi:two-component system chemotaxis sensor kinase CheA